MKPLTATDRARVAGGSSLVCTPESTSGSNYGGVTGPLGDSDSLGDVYEAAVAATTDAFEAIADWWTD